MNCKEKHTSKSSSRRAMRSGAKICRTCRAAGSVVQLLKESCTAPCMHCKFILRRPCQQQIVSGSTCIALEDGNPFRASCGQGRGGATEVCAAHLHRDRLGSTTLNDRSRVLHELAWAQRVALTILLQLSHIHCPAVQRDPILLRQQ